jgi:Phosphotransferase enzyme family
MDFPTTIEQVTAAWIGEQVCVDASSDVSLLRFESKRIGTGLVGENHKLTLHWSQGETLPETLVLKLASSDPTSRATGMALRNYEREVRFYRDVAADVQTRLAHVWAAHWNENTGEFAVLMEDLAPGVVGDQLVGCSIAQAEMAIDVAARIHASFWESPRLREFHEWMSVPADAERAAQLEMLWSMAWPEFLRRHPDGLQPDEVILAERLGSSLGAWVQAPSGPHTLTHGDYRIDNMLFDPVAMVPVDWQTPGVGPGIGDVSYFLGASLLRPDRLANEQRLVRRWFDGLGDAAVGYSWDQCWDGYRRYSLGGAIMGVVASFLTQQTERGDAMFLAMASRHLRQGIDLGASDFL